MKPLLITLLNLSQISLYFSSNSSFFIKKDIYLVSSKSLLYALIFGSITHKDLAFLPSSYPIKYLKSFLPKGTLLDTTILSMFTSYIKIGFLYW